MANQKPVEPSPLERYKNTLETIEKERIFILLTGQAAADVFDAASEIQSGGHRLVCVDFKIPGVIERMKSLKRKGDPCPGVFSVSSAKDARKAINAGAEFIFTTHADKAIARKCRREKVFHAAGALTPKEVYEAKEEGADAVSVYPCSAMGGVSWLIRLKEMYPDIKLIPTDIISPGEAKEYLAAGAYALASIIDIRNSLDARKSIESLMELNNC